MHRVKETIRGQKWKHVKYYPRGTHDLGHLQELFKPMFKHLNCLFHVLGEFLNYKNVVFPVPGISSKETNTKAKQLNFITGLWKNWAGGRILSWHATETFSKTVAIFTGWRHCLLLALFIIVSISIISHFYYTLREFFSMWGILNFEQFVRLSDFEVITFFYWRCFEKKSFVCLILSTDHL